MTLKCEVVVGSVAALVLAAGLFGGLLLAGALPVPVLEPAVGLVTSCCGRV
jgi:hypothetical protein